MRSNRVYATSGPGVSSRFKKSSLCTSLVLAFGSLALVSSNALAQASLDRVEVTGSRIKRADAEGALPVTTIKREELEASGAVTVAEFMRGVTFASAGNFRPQSGSSAQSWASIDLRGLGSGRTLVLLDGRRLPKAPNVGSAVDMNSIPMAAVERIEILTDGASAVYGSDAIGGVVNIITRKNFEGAAVMAGVTRNSNAGGEREEGSALLGISGDKGRVLMGFGTNGRGMVYTRDRPWGQVLGVSTFANNYFNSGWKSIGELKGDPAQGCSAVGRGFYLTASGSCSFNFNAVAADEAEVGQQAFFARGEYKVSNDWTAYLNTSVTSKDSFGRYAPALGQFTVPANTPNNPTAAAITVRHRTAAAGNRDSSTEELMKGITAGFQGKISKNVDVDFGVNWIDSLYKETGRNYLVIPILSQYVADGTYDLFKPFDNPPEVLNAIKATIGRDSYFKQHDVYASATIYDLFKTGGGSASMLVGAERRSEKYSDQYDSLSEAGVIGGSAGNSAAGGRQVSAMAAELLIPISKQIEATLAARYEKYSDYGSDFSPKASVRWQPRKDLTVRGSVGKGFGAPSLPVLTSKESFSAESVFDPTTCLAFGGQTGGTLTAANDCNRGKLVQVETYILSNPSLSSEKSRQFSIGAVWDPQPWLSTKADYSMIKVTDKITSIGAQTLIDRSNGDDPRPIPAGLSVTRDATGAISRIQAGYANEGDLTARYIDLSLLARHSKGGHNFEHEFRLSRLLSYDNDGDEAAGSLGLPRSRATLGNNWRHGQYSATWNVNFIDKNGTTRVAPTYVTHDLQAGIQLRKNTKVTFGMVNAFAKMPELVAYDGRNFNFYLYDSYGRQTYVRLDHKF